jgi:hypothetical protein
MKNLMLYFVAFWVLGVIPPLVSGQDTQDQDKERVEKILQLAVRNLKLTLKGDNDNLKESAMEVVKELKQAYPQARLSGTIIPLMQILRTHADNGMRILAALTLMELGDERGLYAIKEASRFDSSSFVRHICASIQKEIE